MTQRLAELVTSVRTSDGERIALTVITAERHPLPTVLIRTPYGRENLLPEARGWARRGFACVVGDVRGRFDSSGEFLPYTDEHPDGAAVLDWVLDQEFCDGRVITAGASYGAFCAIATAVRRPEAVRGVLAAVPALGLGETAREPGGAARLDCRVGWWCEHAGTSRPRPAFDPDAALLRALPVRGLPRRVLGRTPPGWCELWAADERSPLWQGIAALPMPLFAVGGLTDPFAAHTVDLADTWGGPTRLLLGPWGHRLDAERPGAALAGTRLGALYTRWAQGVLGGGLNDSRAVIAVDADGQWRPMRTDVTQVLALNGTPATFTADPAQPFRSVAFGAPCPVAQERADRVVLRTDVVGPAEVRGSITLRMLVRADACDADWVARISIDGLHVTHAIRRYRASPAALTEVVLRTPPVGCTLRPGARLTVEIAGHHWPRHARNPHTGVDPVLATYLAPSRRDVLAAQARVPLYPVGTDVVAAEDIVETNTEEMTQCPS